MDSTSHHSYIWYVVTWIAGVLMGGAGMYYGDFFTDRRRAREAKQAADNERQAVEDKLRVDCSAARQVVSGLRPWLEQYPTERELAVVPNGNIVGPSGVFRLLETKAPGVTVQAAALANAGHLERIHLDGRFPRYRLTEALVAFIIGHPGRD